MTPERTSTGHPRSALRGATSRGATTRARGLTSRVETTATSTVPANTRTRIVGNRDGALADLIVAAVRIARRVAAGIRGVATRVGSVVTPLGWSLVVVAALSWLVGVRLGWNELFAVSVTSFVLLLVAGLYLVGSSTFTIELTLPHTRVVVGDEATARLRITNPGRFRRFGVKAEVPIGPGLAEFALPGLAPGAEFEHEFTIPAARRGMLPVGPVRTVRGDPLGLVRREISWTDVHELYVHPRTTAVPSSSTGLIRDLEGNPTRDLTNSDVAFHALREYVPGDERRYIHWKSTARTGTYMVRQFEETRRSHLVIALSLAEGDYADEDEFEMAVSVAGSLGVRALRDVRNLSVVVGAETPEFAKHTVLAVRSLDTFGPRRLLDDLALVQRSQASLPLLEMARVTADEVAGISVAFLICGSVPSAAQLRAASVRFPPGVDVVAVTCAPEIVPGLRRVPGLSVLTIGRLDDLKRSLAKAAAL